MLTELCQELKNWFVLKKYAGTFKIENGNLTADFLAEGQYYRIVGSIFNDGVHQYPATQQTALIDEEFNGAVWALGIPKEVVQLSNDIDSWNTQYAGAGSAAMSPFQSESFGGYSYVKASGNSNGSSANGGWVSAFASRLNRWRKI